jgi:hypothetical protein
MAEIVYRLKAGVRNKPSKTYETINWKMDTDANLTYQLTYPSDWRVSVNGNTRNYIQSGGQDVSVSVTVQDMTLVEAQQLLTVFNDPGHHSWDVTVNGIDWRTLESGNQVVQLTFHGGKTYVVQYSTLDNDNAAVFRSFTFLQAS